MPQMVTREKSDYARKVQEKAVIEKVIITILYFAFFGIGMEMIIEFLLKKIIGCMFPNAVQSYFRVDCTVLSTFGSQVAHMLCCPQRQMALERCAAAAGTERPASPASPPPAPAPPAAPPTRVLTLEHGEHHDSTLYRYAARITLPDPHQMQVYIIT